VAGVEDFNAAMSRALANFMLEHGVSRSEVARRLDRAQSYVSGRLNGAHDLSLDIVGAVADIAHVSPDALWIELLSRKTTGQGSSER
jgi:transcriptional regulator with XRE-family HTH domain